LEGEAVRDTLLLLGGDLNLRMGGPSARPALPEGLDAKAWQADARREDRDRRSVYVLAKRNLRFPFFEAFDQPDLHNSCPRRTQTTTAPQALLLLNGGFTLEQAQRFAARLPHEPRRLVAEAYRAAYGRAATDGELALGVRFLEQQTAALAAAGAAADFCHALLNANEFLYVD
jgi:hypothetical protein